MLSTMRQSHSVARNPREAEVETFLCGNSIFTDRFTLKWVRSNALLLKQLQIHSLLGMKVVLPPEKFDMDLSIGGRLLRESVRFCSSDMLQYEPKGLALLKEMSGEALFRELLFDIFCVDGSLKKVSMSKKIARNCLLLSRADRCTIFFLEGSYGEQKLICQATDASKKSYEEGCPAIGLACPVGFGVAGHVVETACTVNIDVGPAHTMFDGSVDVISGCDPILCVPITAPNGQVLGAAQLSGRDINDNEGVFCREDEEILETYLAFVAIAMINSGYFDDILMKAKQLEALLTLSKGVFQDISSLESTMNKILLETHELLPCSACRYLLIDDSAVGASKDLVFTHVYEMTHKHQPIGGSQDGGSKEMESLTAQTGDLKAAAQVASTGEAVIIKSAPEADEKVNALYMPVFGLNGVCIGVTQFVNKLTTEDFTGIDVECYRVFAIFCGLAIHNAMSYAKLSETNSHQQTALNCLCQPRAAMEKDVQKLLKREMPSFSNMGINAFHFDDLYCDDEASVLVISKMFYTCELVKKFSIRREDLIRWVSSVKQNYRPLTYHNWRHVFNVVQTLFAMFTVGEVGCWMSDLEKLALFIAALCHDLEHKGASNSLQEMTTSPLAELYSASTVGKRSFELCIKTLNSTDESRRILRHLTADEYYKVIMMVEDAILSTDLSVYFKRRDDFGKLVADKTFDWLSDGHKKLLRSMMMAACDLSAITKPWKIHKRVSNQITRDYFDLECERKNLANTHHGLVEWKAKFNIHQQHVDFVIDVCNPLYQDLSKLHSGFQPLYHGMLKNHGRWVHLAKLKAAENQLVMEWKIEDKEHKKKTSENTTECEQANNVQTEHNKDDQGPQEEIPNVKDDSPKQIQTEQAADCDEVDDKLQPAGGETVTASHHEENDITQQDASADSGIVLESFDYEKIADLNACFTEDSVKSQKEKKKRKGAKVLRVLKAPIKAIKRLLKLNY